MGTKPRFHYDSVAELAHQHLGQELVEKIRDDLSEYGTVEQEPKMEGRQIVMVLAPVKKR